MQHVKRILPFHQIIRVGVRHRRRNRLIGNVSAVQKYRLIRFIRFGKILIADIAANFYAVFIRVDPITIIQRSRAVHAGESRLIALAVRLQNVFSVYVVSKRHVGTGKDKTRHERGDIRLFRAIGF